MLTKLFKLCGWSTLWSFFHGAALIFCLSGCSTTNPLEDVVIGPGYVPRNIYEKDPALPPTLRRVAVLPLSYADLGAMGVSAQESLEPLLLTELGKANRFEILRIRPEQLQQWTGAPRWDAQETLPADLIKTLRERTGCDGIFFAHITRYHPYPPLVAGWRMRLITAPEGETLWSADEVFDASEASVSNAARRYSKDHVKNNPVLEQSRGILLSPSRFGQYTLSALIETLPKR